jgi:CspA family cold shock protein
MASEKITGKVKWFNNAKGYGFILPDDGGDDLFAHYSSIEMEGYKTLKAGQEVQFEILAGPKGLHATHIEAGEEPVESAEVSVNGVAFESPETDGNTTEVLSVTVADADALEGHTDEHLENGHARQSN